MRAERLSTDFPLVSLTLFSMTDKIACSDFSSCRTLLIGAKELRRIFLGFCVLHTFTAYPLMRFFTTQWEILPPDKGALPDKQPLSFSRCSKPIHTIARINLFFTHCIHRGQRKANVSRSGKKNLPFPLFVVRSKRFCPHYGA